MNVKINLADVPLNSPQFQFYPEYLLEEKTNLKYFPIEVFRQRLNVSESTVRRLISRVKNKRTERYFVLFHGKYYLSLNIREPLIAGTDIRESFTQYLKKYDWKIWGSVNFNERMNLSQIRKLAEQHFDQLKIKYPEDSFTFFFASEMNNARDGYHFHYLLDFTNVKLFDRIMKTSTSFFNKKRKNLLANTLIERFDSKKDGISYILKQIKKVPDGYDVFLS